MRDRPRIDYLELARGPSVPSGSLKKENWSTKKLYPSTVRRTKLENDNASGGMDRYDCRVFMLLTHRAAGGLPVGCLIVTSESIGLHYPGIKTVLYRRHTKRCLFWPWHTWPLCFLSHDSEAERQSLAAVFPDATLILCVFNLLLAVWRFLWEGKNHIRKEHRPQLLFAVKKMTFSMSENTLEEAY